MGGTVCVGIGKQSDCFIVSAALCPPIGLRARWESPFTLCLAQRLLVHLSTYPHRAPPSGVASEALRMLEGLFVSVRHSGIIIAVEGLWFAGRAKGAPV